MPGPIARRVLLLCTLSALALSAAAAQAQAGSAPAPAPPGVRDGQRDFDFWLGTWKARSRRLERPLSGSSTWIEFDAVNVTTAILGGRAWIDEYAADRPTGRVEGMTMGLYDPNSGDWSLYWWNPTTGPMSPPVIGRFTNGRGEFFSQEQVQGRTVLVRQLWLSERPGTLRWEQAYSTDGGKTWETNGISDWVRQR